MNLSLLNSESFHCLFFMLRWTAIWHTSCQESGRSQFAIGQEDRRETADLRPDISTRHSVLHTIATCETSHSITGVAGLDKFLTSHAVNFHFPGLEIEQCCIHIYILIWYGLCGILSRVGERGYILIRPLFLVTLDARQPKRVKQLASYSSVRDRAV